MNRYQAITLVCRGVRCPYRGFANDLLYCIVKGERNYERQELGDAYMIRSGIYPYEYSSMNLEPFVVPEGCSFQLEMELIRDQLKESLKDQGVNSIY